MGFMFATTKVGFGIFFHPHTTYIQYIGTHIEGRRCGYGKTYSKTGEVLYTWEWINDKPLTEFILNYKEPMSPMALHSQLKDIIIGDNSFNNPSYTTSFSLTLLAKR